MMTTRYGPGFGRGAGSERGATANLRTKILDFGGFDSSGILIPRGGSSYAQKEFIDKFESTNLSRENIRMRMCTHTGFQVVLGANLFSRFANVHAHVRPISLLRFWISEGFTQT